MRRIFITFFFSLALLAGVPEVNAQTNSYDAFGNAYSTPAEASAADTKALSAAATASTAQSAGGGTPITPKASSDDAYNIVMQKIMELFAWLVGVAALTLDTAVFYTVVQMGAYVNKLAAIGVAWSILRDVGNIMLIFGFLAIGITTILNVEWYGGGKKMLPMLFIGAIFLNFSLFITEAVIDTGNLFATQFYKQINGGNLPTAAMTQSSTVQDEGISNKLMAQLGLQTLYNVNSGKVNKEVFSGTSPWLIGFMGILLFIVTAFVMFSLAFVLIARFVILIFLIILAPVGFAGLAVPQLRARAKQWWDALFEQTLTAPVLLLMLYVALAVITDAQFLTGFNPTKGGLLDFVNNNNLAGFGGVMLSFLVAMGLLLFVVVASKKLSAFGAGWASQTAGKLSFGLTAAGLRGTAGWGLQRASTGWRKTALSRAPIIGRAVSGALDSGAKANFDVRGAAIAGGLKGIGVDAGAAQKGGFRDWEKGKTKEREDYAKDLQQTTGKFMGLKYAKGEVDKQKDAEAEVRAAEANLRVAKYGNDEAAIKTAEGALGRAQAEVKNIKIAPQAGYAKGLNLYIDKEKGGFLRGAVGVLNPLRNTKAAENILKEAKKSKAEKDFENFKKLIEEKAKEEKPKEEKKEEPKAEAAH
ncbi:MAG: hypothetical protein WC790_01555 [Candidatus Paceibacterota bacterium]|jgi:hypothetical protein